MNTTKTPSFKISSKHTIIKSIYCIVCIILLVILLLLFYIKYYKHEGIDIFTNPIPTVASSLTTSPNPIDRTKLYGSLFLDNLDKIVKNMSNPDIKYEDKRIELNNYSDILL